AAMPGKIKTTSQMFSIIFLFLNNIFFANIHLPIGEILLYICLFFTIYSGVEYFYNARDVFADSFGKD
ncbi:MAG TPA: CDP-diacylglycerol--glycerol-3-phosphate 3-phosphatidyltransferase, partial [Candidatus Ligilactobacillus excrementipullorum]|nr:CDP-diacylglycerol--glycerol-3-phosphate 3-phosphatidyltransferase [Candidatus Ligilactobacillus excrementipullorum]